MNDFSKPTHTYTPRQTMKAGDVFGKLTAIHPTRKNKHNLWLWLFSCECGNHTEKPATAVRHGKVKSCGCLMPLTRNHKRDPATGHFLLFEKGEGKSGKDIAARYVWSNKDLYADGCSFEDFLRLSQEPCHYCGLKHSCKVKRKGEWFLYNGLDRKDPNLTHTLDNVVPCCKFCNYAKHTMQYQEFLDWLSRAYHYTFTHD
jgi:hypothetical protein